MPIKAEQLPAALDRGLAGIYLIGGPEPLLVQECRDLVCGAAKQQGFLERELLHADGAFEWDHLEQVGSAPSLFASRKIIDLRLPNGKPGAKGAKALVDWAGNPDPDLLLIISCEQWDRSSRSSKWATVLDRSGVRVDIWPVRPEEMPRWIEGRLRGMGLEPDREAVMMLAERLEGNLLAAKQEIEKLALLKGRGRVTGQDVTRAVADSSRFDAFLLVERVLAGDLRDSLRVALGLRRTGVPLQLVTGALVRELRLLESYRRSTRAGESEEAVFRRLNIWQNRQAPMRNAARRIGEGRLFSALCTLSLMDRQSKGQADGDAWHSLDRLVCDLCAG